MLKKKNKGTEYRAPLKLPYLSDNVSNKIRNYVKSRKLPVRIIFTLGNTLRQMFCSSRPFDKPSCVLGNPKKCQICPKITNGTCAMKHGVYRLNCLLCEGSQDFYEGETDRPAHNRFMEHTKAGNNPASYSSNGIGKHYAMYHPTHKQCQLTFTFIDKQSNSVQRKILEAIKIHKDEPNFNNKEELVDTMKIIVRWSVYNI